VEVTGGGDDRGGVDVGVDGVGHFVAPEVSPL
jgi:hypothetical protein